MTREQAIIRLRRISYSLRKYCDVNDCIRGNCAKCYGALDKAVEALEKEPNKEYDYPKSLWKRPKRGKWIDRDYCQVDEDAYEVATCSNCKAEITLEYPYDSFCPNCGARMESGEE